tara:strand:- start:802 stop:960 length:159 start_codon:yes stop_codon:yes gene_type:complete
LDGIVATSHWIAGIFGAEFVVIATLFVTHTCPPDTFVSLGTDVIVITGLGVL